MIEAISEESVKKINQAIETIRDVLVNQVAKFSEQEQLLFFAEIEKMDKWW